MGDWPENRLQVAMPIADLEEVRDLKFTDIRGFKLLNTTGHQVGSVKDVFVDPNTLEPCFALLTYEKFMNFNPKSLLVPWSELTIGPDYVQTRAAEHTLLRPRVGATVPARPMNDEAAMEEEQATPAGTVATG